MGKRFFDLLVVILTSPVWLIVVGGLAIIIKFRLGSPVLFVQDRGGYRCNKIKLYKFRTMNDDRDEDGELLPDHNRLTKLGRFLRQASLDELPSLINVLKGELSLVGPRPFIYEYMQHYNDEQIRRHDVRPGVTGWAQVNGRNALSWEDKFKLDVWYVDNRSMWLDLKILKMTVKKVLYRDGISADGEVTMPKFRGSSGQP